MKRKIAIIILACLALLAFGGFLFKNKKQAKTYITEPLQKRTITQIVEASGTINPVQTVSIGSQVSGQISAIYVDYNSEVKKGQLLAEIDTSLFEAQVNQAKASIDNARANLAKIQATAANDKLTLNRYKNLYKKGFIAKSELDLAESTYSADVAQIRAAQAQINQALASYSTAESNLRYTKITSPVDGVVISRAVDVGQTVAASFQTPELFSVAQDLTQMQIEASVSEADIGKVKKHQNVEYTLDGYPDETFTGKVSQVRISPTTVSNVVTYSVIIDVNNDDLKLIPGMTANVSIITSKKEDILCAQNAALKFTPNTDGKGEKYEKQGIWLLSEGVPKRVEIRTGVSDDSYTEIISDKLHNGDNAIISIEEKGKGKDANKGRKMPPRMF